MRFNNYIFNMFRMGYYDTLWGYAYRSQKKHREEFEQQMIADVYGWGINGIL